MNLSILFATILVLVVIALSSSASLVVDAAIPSNVECKCENGGVRDTTVNYCLCTGCTAPYVLPFCSFQATSDVEFGITYNNWTTLEKDLFPYDRAESNIKNHFGIVEANFNFVRRIPNFEAGSNEIVAGFLMKGSDVIQLYNDVFAAEKKPYLQDPQALNMWQLGTVVSAPGIFSRHFGTGNNLAVVAIGSGEFRVNDRQLEFFIAAIAIVIFLPILDSIVNCIFRPSAEELDEQERKYGDGETKTRDQDYFNNNNNNIDNENKNVVEMNEKGGQQDSSYQQQSPMQQQQQQQNENQYPTASYVTNGNTGETPSSYQHQENNNTATETPQASPENHQNYNPSRDEMPHSAV